MDEKETLTAAHTLRKIISKIQNFAKLRLEQFICTSYVKLGQEIREKWR